MKLLLPHSPLGPDTFADFEVSDEGGSSDLLLYVGGAISSQEYVARRAIPPSDLLSLLKQSQRSASVLVVSYPASLSGRPAEAAEPFADHFRQELIPALPVRPERLALVGFSLGAALAVTLARIRGVQTVRLATVGAVGAAEALTMRSPSFGPLPCPVLVAVNEGDHCGMYSRSFVGELSARGVVHDVKRGIGGHPFRDYARNGLLHAAVRFVADAFEGRGAMASMMTADADPPS